MVIGQGAPSACGGLDVHWNSWAVVGLQGCDNSSRTGTFTAEDHPLQTSRGTRRQKGHRRVATRRASWLATTSNIKTMLHSRLRRRCRTNHIPWGTSTKPQPGLDVQWRRVQAVKAVQAKGRLDFRRTTGGQIRRLQYGCSCCG